MEQSDDLDPDELPTSYFEEDNALPDEPELTIAVEVECARQFLSKLMARAFGEAPESGYPAFRELISLLSDQLGRFELLCLYNHEVCEHLAPKLEAWPALYHAHPELRREAEKRLRMFGLGLATGVNTSGRSFSFGTPAIKVILRLLRVTQSARGHHNTLHAWDTEAGFTAPSNDAQRARFDRWMREVAPRLPDLTRATWKEWAEGTHELFESMYGEEYQDHPELAEITKQVTETDKKGAISRGRQRSAIKKSLRQAWQTVSGFEVNKD